MKIDSFRLALLLSLQILQTNAAKPNVLVVIADDMAPQYKEMNAITPELDDFAANGVTFDRAYVQMSVSAPSRMVSNNLQSMNCCSSLSALR